jgi:hypothetical protein
VLELNKLGTFEILIEKIQALAEEIRQMDANIKICQDSFDSKGPRLSELTKRRKELQNLLKRKLFRYLMVLRTVLRMISGSGVRISQGMSLTKTLNELMRFADPLMQDKMFTLEYVKYLGRLVSASETEISEELLEASYLLEIIANKRILGNGDNLLAGSVSFLLVEMTKKEHFKLQKTFVEQNRFLLDSASEYLFGADQIIKADKLFKGNYGDGSKDRPERLINRIMRNSRMSAQTQTAQGVNGQGGDFRENGMPLSENSEALEIPFSESRENEGNSSSVLFQASSGLSKDKQRVQGSHQTVAVAPMRDNSIEDLLQEKDTPDVFESFQRDFEATKQKSKSKKLCAYDDSDSDEDMFDNSMKDHSSPLSRKIINPAALDGDFEVRRRKSSEDFEDVFPGRKKAMEMFARKVSSDSNAKPNGNSSENSPPPAQLKLELDYPSGLQKRAFPFDDKDDEDFSNISIPRPFPK